MLKQIAGKEKQKGPQLLERKDNSFFLKTLLDLEKYLVKLNKGQTFINVIELSYHVLELLKNVT